MLVKTPRANPPGLLAGVQTAVTGVECPVSVFCTEFRVLEPKLSVVKFGENKLVPM
jgi:hypothetical protein